MTPILTEKEFAQHVNTKFRVKLDVPGPVDLELVQVKGYMKKPDEQDGMERFSVFFNGPDNPLLAQASYPLEHELMGSFDLFLVPIGRDEKGFKYEAVFNYYKS
jgi:hypothetical protein